MAISTISLESQIANIKKSFAPDGFYVYKDNQLLFIRLIQEVNDPQLFEKFENYGIEFISSEDDETQVDGIDWNEKEEIVGSGLETLSLGYSQKAQEVQSSTGPILEVDDTEASVAFTVQTEPHFSSDFYAVFLLDRIDSAVRFTGIFSPKKQKVIHLSGFYEDTRGSYEIVTCGNFKGVPLGDKGSGPRSILITGENLRCKYLIQYLKDGKRLQPHQDKKNYNKDQRSLFQTTLNAFVSLYEPNEQIPTQFPFDCYKNSEYIATLDE